MNLFEIIILAIALGIDCLIVSFSQGLLVKLERKKISLILASIMGFFQGSMPLISYLLTKLVYEQIAPFAKFLVFGIFIFLGVKFIKDAFDNDENEIIKRLGYKVMLILGIATSIDALGAGVSLKLTNSSLISSCLIIAMASFLMSIIGFWSACLIKNLNSKALQISAGLVLILLALKALM